MNMLAHSDAFHNDITVKQFIMGSIKRRVIIRSTLNAISSMFAFVYRAFRPVRYFWNRIFYLSLAKGQLKNLPASVQFDGPVHLAGTCRINIDEESRIGRDVELGTEEDGRINIGSCVRINRGSTIFSYDHISIGDYTMIGEFVTIRDANHGIDSGRLIRNQPHKAQAIHIGRDVWIGRGVCILPGVSIGDGAVVGANSVVTKSIPAGKIAVGSPARVVKKR